MLSQLFCNSGLYIDWRCYCRNDSLMLIFIGPFSVHQFILFLT